jgi:WD40 repeat protein
VADRANPVHGGWLSVAFDPHGKRLVTGGINGTVAVWDAATDGPPLTTFQWGVGPVYAVTFDRDGLRAAAAGHYGAVVWDVDE